MTEKEFKESKFNPENQSPVKGSQIQSSPVKEGVATSAQGIKEEQKVIDSYFDDKKDEAQSDPARSLKYSEYIDVQLDQIQLQLKEDAKDSFEGKPLAKSEDVSPVDAKPERENEPFPELKSLRAKLQAIKLPKLKHLSEKDVDRDMFFAFKRPAVLQFVSLFLVGAACLNEYIK
ncbi:hypothetical protein FGO68_gene910 [Halteria grandinella]|uniref:Uncharacterized protein n=1 Tax=Halteria grandinella TaxID=5974 RepID=A0A8J8TB14_HALGN|nr:hypothetical protein FGO68_gene910 [Halteria grandinella]